MTPQAGVVTTLVAPVRLLENALAGVLVLPLTTRAHCKDNKRLCRPLLDQLFLLSVLLHGRECSRNPNRNACLWPL